MGSTKKDERVELTNTHTQHNNSSSSSSSSRKRKVKKKNKQQERTGIYGRFSLLAFFLLLSLS